ADDPDDGRGWNPGEARDPATPHWGEVKGRARGLARRCCGGEEAFLFTTREQIVRRVEVSQHLLGGPALEEIETRFAGFSEVAQQGRALLRRQPASQCGLEHPVVQDLAAPQHASSRIARSSSRLIAARNRTSRLVTVPCGMPRRSAISRVVCSGSPYFRETTARTSGSSTR